MYISCKCGKRRQEIDAFPLTCYPCLNEQHPGLKAELEEAEEQAKVNVSYAMFEQQSEEE